jgi:uncharacterized protein (TIGR00730 family)
MLENDSPKANGDGSGYAVREGRWQAPAAPETPAGLLGQAPVREKIAELLRAVGPAPTAGLVEEIIRTAVRLVEDGASRGDVKIITSALKELRYSFKVFAPYGHVRKVTIFGSARIPEDAPEYVQAMAFARAMAEAGFMVITGAGDGIMKAGHGGAGRERSFGVNIRLPFEQRANTVIEGDSKLIHFKYFFTRKLIFLKQADAVALFPGGFGTLDEAFEVLTLLQTGKGLLLPIVCLDQPGGTYWHAWRGYLEELLGRGLISKDDFNFVRITGAVDEAVDEILRFYRRYHSSRYVGDRLVLRMTSPLPAGAVEALNAEFGTILRDGRIEAAGALPEEANEPEIADLPRLVLAFNRRDFGRLRRLIDAINAA